MQSLEIMTCMKIVEGMDFSEIVDFINQNRNNRIGQFCDSDQFWKVVIDKFYTENLLQQRLDIHARNYKQLALDLQAGNTTFYSTVINLDEPEQKMRGPVEVFDIDDDSLIVDIDDHLINVEIIGTKPKRGTIGYMANYRFAYDANFEVHLNMFYLAHDLESLEEAEFNLKYRLAEMAYADFIRFRTDHKYAFNTAEGPIILTLRGNGSKEMFIKTFLATQSIKADPFATEFFVSSYEGVDTFAQVWVAQVVF